MASWVNRFQAVLERRQLPLMLALLSILLGTPALWTGLQVDDYLSRSIMKQSSFAQEHYDGPIAMFDFVSGDPARTRELIDLGLLPWWTLETVRLRFYRPVTVFTHWLDYQLWPDTEFLMHVQNLLWFALAMSLVAVLYRRLMMSAWVAGLAALFYVVDDAHSMAAGWVANRNASLMLLFGVLSLLAHVRWRSEPATNIEKAHAASRWSWALLAHLFLLLSVLSNEGGIAVTAYLFAYAMFLDKGTLIKRFFTLVPYAVLIIVWQMLYNLMGYGTWGSQAYVDPVRTPLRFLLAALERAPALFIGQWAFPPCDIQIMSPFAIRMGLIVAGTVLFICLAAAFAPLLRRNPPARFWFTGMLLSIIPICAPFPMDRLLMFVGIGAMGLLAQFISFVFQASATKPHRLVRALCWSLICIHLLLAPLLFPLRIMGFALFGNTLNSCLESIPFEDNIEDRTLVIINSPNPFFMYYIPLLRSLEGESVPKYMRSLGPADIFPTTVSMTRKDDRTMVVWSDVGFRWMLCRDNVHPLAVGEIVQLSGMSAEVLTLAPQGWPHMVAFQFDKPLEDPEFQWLRFSKGYFVPWNPPDVGETLTLNPYQ